MRYYLVCEVPNSWSTFKKTQQQKNESKTKQKQINKETQQNKSSRALQSLESACLCTVDSCLYFFAFKDYDYEAKSSDSSHFPSCLCNSSSPDGPAALPPVMCCCQGCFAVLQWYTGLTLTGAPLYGI